MKRVAPILDDILKAIDGAATASAPHTLETFSQNWVVRTPCRGLLKSFQKLVADFPPTSPNCIQKFHGAESEQSEICCDTNTMPSMTKWSGASFRMTCRT